MNSANLRVLFRPLLAALMLLAGPLALAVRPVEGVNYKLLKPAVPTNVAPGKVEVVEVFWYACGHCYMLEPKIEAWERKGKPANVEVIRMPAVWNELLKTHARLFYTIEVLGKPELNDRGVPRDQRARQPARYAREDRGFLHLARRRARRTSRRRSPGSPSSRSWRGPSTSTSATASRALRP